MTAGLVNEAGDDLHLNNGTFELLRTCGAGLLAGWAPSWRPDREIYLNEDGDNFSFTVDGAADCKLFGRLLRIYVKVLEERCVSYEKVNGHEVANEDRAWGAFALLRRDELPYLIEIAEFFERSEKVERTH